MDELVDTVALRPSPRGNISERLRDWVIWFGLGRIVTISLSVVAVGAGGYWLVRPPPDPVESSLPRADAAFQAVTTLVPGAITAPAAEAAGTTVTVEIVEIVVHVAGAVMAPGVHRLDPGARVVDAVAAAGGPTPDALLDAINLAQPLRDGDRLVVPVAGGPAAPVAGGVTAAIAEPGPPGDPSGGLVDLNSATAAELDELPGVGPATAQAIVSHRDANGPFASVDGLADVRGIGPAKLEALRPLVTV